MIGETKPDVLLGACVNAAHNEHTQFLEQSFLQSKSQLTPGFCCDDATADSVFCFFNTMLLSSKESLGRGRLGPSVACIAMADHLHTGGRSSARDGIRQQLAVSVMRHLAASVMK